MGHSEHLPFLCFWVGLRVRYPAQQHSEKQVLTRYFGDIQSRSGCGNMTVLATKKNKNIFSSYFPINIYLQIPVNFRDRSQQQLYIYLKERERGCQLTDKVIRLPKQSLPLQGLQESRGGQEYSDSSTSKCLVTGEAVRQEHIGQSWGSWRLSTSYLYCRSLP